jgi:hypothetical protein
MLFAHLGGWDGLIWIAVPLAPFAALLYIASREPKPSSDADDDDDDGPEDE